MMSTNATNSKMNNNGTSPVVEMMVRLTVKEENCEFDQKRDAGVSHKVGTPPNTPEAVKSQGKSRGPYERLPLNLQLSLLIDIQDAGGIDKIGSQSGQQALCDLCDKRPEIYGHRGDPLRTKIQNRVKYLKQKYKKSPDSWNRELDFFAGISASEKQQPANNPQQKHLSNKQSLKKEIQDKRDELMRLFKQRKEVNNDPESDLCCQKIKAQIERLDVCMLGLILDD